MIDFYLGKNHLELVGAVCAAVLVVLPLFKSAFGDVREERLSDLANICAFIPSDNLDAAVPEPTPDDVIVKYHVTTNVVVEDLKEIVRRSNIAETNFYAQVPRQSAVSFIGRYGCTNDLPFIVAILTNSTDYAADVALGATMNITRRTGCLTNFVNWVVSDTNTFNSTMRRAAYIRLYDLGVESLQTGCHDLVDSVAGVFLYRAGVEHTDSVMFVDRAACEFNPWYRHSRQRRDNLAALRPPGLTGKPAELYDAAQADAAQED